MRIFSKKAFAIGPGAQRGTDEIETFITVPGSFQEMPDKYKHDPTFLLAVKAGEITVITAASQQREMEKQAADDTGVREDAPPQTALEAFFEELKVMNQEDVLHLAEKYNVKPKNGEKLNNLKKRVFEAYKLANADEDEGTDETDGDSEDSDN